MRSIRYGFLKTAVVFFGLAAATALIQNHSPVFADQDRDLSMKQNHAFQASRSIASQ